MYQGYIKNALKTIGAILGCILLLAVVSLLIFADKIEERKIKNQAQSVLLSQQQNNASNQNQAANTERFKEGKHYQRLSAKITTQPIVQNLVAQDRNKIQIIEFFNYACFWCQRLHPRLTEWEMVKPEHVILHRFPIIFNKGWEVMAKAYLMVQILGETKNLDPKFFQAIHVENQDLANEKLLQEFFAKHGVDQQKFLSMYGSFAVSRALSHSTELMNAYQLTVSPAIIVNGPSGSYLITASLAGTEAAILDVVNFLVEKESKILDK